MLFLAIKLHFLGFPSQPRLTTGGQVSINILLLLSHYIPLSPLLNHIVTSYHHCLPLNASHYPHDLDPAPMLVLELVNSGMPPWFTTPWRSKNSRGPKRLGKTWKNGVKCGQFSKKDGEVSDLCGKYDCLSDIPRKIDDVAIFFRFIQPTTGN